MSAPVLSAVIVARNEEAFIGPCIEAVRVAAAPFADFDAVVVDSRSTDATVEVARRHGMTTGRVRPGIRCTAALGRAAGQAMTRGRYLLFVDGDTMIEGEWLRHAVALLDQDPSVAGVAGKLREVYYRGGQRVGESDDFFRMGPVAEEVHQLGGNAVYRRAALDEAGSFHPGVISYEEAELAERLRRRGHRLIRLPLPVGTHHTGARDTWECWRRFRGGLMVGYGQVLRLTLGTPSFASHVRALNRYLLCLGFLGLGVVAAVASLVAGRGTFVVAWVLAAVALFAALALKARSVRQPAAVLADWVLAAPGIVWGFLAGPLRDVGAPERLVDVLPGDPPAVVRQSGAC